MEEYEDMENDAFDTSDASGAPDATTVTVRQLAVGVERNRFGNARVLKAASENVAKRVKMRETRQNCRSCRQTNGNARASDGKSADGGMEKKGHGGGGS